MVGRLGVRILVLPLMLLTSGLAPALAEETPAELLQRGSASQAAGHLDAAAEDYKAALSQAGQQSDPHATATALLDLGSLRVLRGERDMAFRTLDDALKMARQNQFRDVESGTLVNRAVLLASAGRPKAATQTIEEAFSRADGLPELRTLAALYASRLAVKDGKVAESERWLEEARQSLESVHAPEARGDLMLKRARLELDRFAAGVDQADVLGLLEAVFQAAVARGDPRSQSYALGYLGEFQERSGHLPEAFAATRRALLLAQGEDLADLAYQWYWQLGRLERAAGHPERAIERYRDAIAAVQAIRLDMPVVDAISGEPVFRRRVGPVFSGLADLLLQASDATSDPVQRQALLRAAREAIESFKAAEMEDYFRNRCVTGSGDSVSLDAVAENAVVLYPIILEDRLELLISTRADLRHVSVPVTAANLRREVSNFRRRLEEYDLSADIVSPARQLYDWLIRPVEADLGGHSPLVFVPDDVLRTLPLAALHDGQGWLVQRLAVVVVPGLRLTEFTPAEAEGESPGAAGVLLAGLSQSQSGFPALPGVEKELGEIRHYFQAEDALNDSFTRDRIDHLITEGGFSLMHFASHAVFSGDPATSFILTHDGRITMAELEQFIRQSGGKKGGKVDLLTLSACETAAGNDRAALGLAGAAVKGGARSVVSSLWPISDAAASTLLPTFYASLSRGQKSKAEALRQAQLALINRPDYQHPSFWSPFILIGRWQ